MSEYFIYIEDEDMVYPVDLDTYGDTSLLTCGRKQWYVFPDTETAGEAARDYWQELAENDPDEFTALVGEGTLVAWALGRYAGPGSTQVTSLEEWLDLWLDTPEEHFASYDGEELNGTVCKSLQADLGLDDKHVVLYRFN